MIPAQLVNQTANVAPRVPSKISLRKYKDSVKSKANRNAKDSNVIRNINDRDPESERKKEVKSEQKKELELLKLEEIDKQCQKQCISCLCVIPPGGLSIICESCKKGGVSRKLCYGCEKTLQLHHFVSNDSVLCVKCYRADEFNSEYNFQPDVRMYFVEKIFLAPNEVIKRSESVKNYDNLAMRYENLLDERHNLFVKRSKKTEEFELELYRESSEEKYKFYSNAENKGKKFTSEVATAVRHGKYGEYFGVQKIDSVLEAIDAEIEKCECKINNFTAENSQKKTEEFSAKIPENIGEIADFIRETVRAGTMNRAEIIRELPIDMPPDQHLAKQSAIVAETYLEQFIEAFQLCSPSLQEMEKDIRGGKPRGIFEIRPNADIISSFLHFHTARAPDEKFSKAKVSASDLYKYFRKFCVANNLPCLSQTAFGTKIYTILEKRGIRRYNTGGTRAYRGLLFVSTDILDRYDESEARIVPEENIEQEDDENNSDNNS